jgi:hypothetical protein
MRLLKQLSNLLFKSKNKPIDNEFSEKKNVEYTDKVGNFNILAPQLFSTELNAIGYELRNIKDYENGGFLSSTHHIYVNEKLNLILDIQQAPYYTDYGFSIFLTSSERKEQKLLCNVPHELQESNDKFLVIMRDSFFSDPDIISLLKGEIWKTINPLRIN